MALYYFSGIEAYLKRQEMQKIVSTVPSPEINVMEAWEDTPEIQDFVNAFPFIGDKKICILHFFPDKEIFLSIIKGMAEEADIYILTDEMPDRRKKVIKQILEQAVIKDFPKISSQLLYKCISSRLKRYGYMQEEIDSCKEHLEEAFHSYETSMNIDLDVVQKHVDMIGLSGRLDKENIDFFAPESERIKAYKLSSMLLDRDRDCLVFAKRLIQQGDSAIGILSLVLYQIRICYKSVLFQKEKYLSLIGIREFQLYRNFLSYSAGTYKMVYRIFLDGICRIKKGEIQEVVVLECLSRAVEVLDRQSSQAEE